MNMYEENKSCINNITKTYECSDDGIYNKPIVEIPLWYHTTISVFLTSIGINGVLLNGLVLRHFWIRRNIQTPYVTILVNLTAAELTLSVFGVSSDVIALILHGWAMGKKMCIATGALVTTSGFVSILTLCEIRNGLLVKGRGDG